MQDSNDDRESFLSDIIDLSQLQINEPISDAIFMISISKISATGEDSGNYRPLNRLGVEKYKKILNDGWDMVTNQYFFNI